jgi:hypothetical protein
MLASKWLSTGMLPAWKGVLYRGVIPLATKSARYSPDIMRDGNTITLCNNADNTLESYCARNLTH